MKTVLAISARDNVATALEALESGRRVEANGVSVTAVERIAAGEAVIKYGSPIGLATADIAAGAHVHTHNVAGSRGRGDLEAAAEPRLAEPPDTAPVNGR